MIFVDYEKAKQTQLAQILYYLAVHRVDKIYVYLLFGFGVQTNRFAKRCETGIYHIPEAVHQHVQRYLQVIGLG